MHVLRVIALVRTSACGQWRGSNRRRMRQPKRSSDLLFRVCAGEGCGTGGRTAALAWHAEDVRVSMQRWLAQTRSIPVHRHVQRCAVRGACQGCGGAAPSVASALLMSTAEATNSQLEGVTKLLKISLRKVGSRTLEAVRLACVVSRRPFRCRIRALETLPLSHVSWVLVN